MGIANMPLFPGCHGDPNIKKEDIKMCSEKKLLKYIDSNLKYPEEAKKNNIKDFNVVSILINEDGVLSNIKLVKKIGFGCDEEALRLVNNMPDWIPAKLLTGENFAIKLNIPIKFGYK